MQTPLFLASIMMLTGMSAAQNVPAPAGTPGKPGDQRSRLSASLAEAGRVEFHAGRFQNAKKYFERVLRELDAGSELRADALRDAGHACLALGQGRVAEVYFREAIAIAPGQATHRYGLGQSLLLQRRDDAAEATFRTGLALEPGNPLLLHELAVVLIRRKQFREGLDLMHTALGLTTELRARGRIMRNMALIEWHLGSREAALARLREALTVMEAAVGPEHLDTAQLWADYSEALSRTGAKAEARDAHRRATSILSRLGDYSRDATIDWRELRR